MKVTIKRIMHHSGLQNNARYLGILMLLLGLCAGCGIADSQSESTLSQTESISHGNLVEIQGELQWNEDFSWTYCPEKNGSTDELIGYFVREVDSKNPLAFETQDSGKVLVFRQEFSEVSFYEQIKERENQYEGCLIDIIGGTELTLAARVEADKMYQEEPYGNCYELYLQQGEVGYTFQAMDLKKIEWYGFLKELLLTADLHWREQDAYTDTVFLTLINLRKKPEWDCWLLQFDGVLLPMEWEYLTSCNLYEDGLRICYIQYSWQEEEPVAAECLLRHVEAFPAFETESELFDWFRERIPSIRSYAAYLIDEVFETARSGDENTAWVMEKTPYREIMTEDGQCLLYLTYKDQYYEFYYDTAWGGIWRCPFDERITRSILGIGWQWDIGYEVTVSENGLTNRYDNLREKYYLQREIGEDIFSFAVEYVYQPGDEERAFEDIGYLWKISIYRNGESEAFQEIEVDSSAFYACPVSFYDFNADGYEDLIVYYYYGANGGSESRYLWSPSRESFVYFPDLEYYGSYYVDPETRRLYIHYHGSAISGIDEVYQWQNEMDCELLKRINYYPASFDSLDMVIKVARYDGAREEILSDYIYSEEEFYTRDGDIWGAYFEDFIWEQEVTVDGETYILRYAQSQMEDPVMEWQINYYGRLYVYREDTYLIRVIGDEINSPWSRMEWVEKDDEKWPWSDWPELDDEKCLVIHFKDSWTGEEIGAHKIPVSYFKIPDWQPDGSQKAED